jgi:hypothetical protein
VRQIAVPRAERSGSHLVVDVEVGDVRQIVAAVAGVATMARAQGVGPRALRDLLPELRAAVTPVAHVVARALLPAADVIALSTGLADEARRAVDAIVGSARRAGERVLAAVEEAERRGIGARTRLALQAACDDGVDTLARVRAAIELLQRASASEPLAVSLDDLFHELDGELGGETVDLYVDYVDGEASTMVAVQPRVATALLAGALARVRATRPADAFGARVTTVENGRVRVEIAPLDLAPAGRAPLIVHVPSVTRYDELVLGLAAASLAAPLGFELDHARIDLLRA